MSIPVMMVAMRLAFVFWLIIAYVLFMRRFARRSFFALRVGASAVGLLVISAVLGYSGYLFLNYLNENGIRSEFAYPVLNVVVHVALFAMSIGAVFLCFKEKPVTLIFGCISGYSLQNIAVMITNIIGTLAPWYKFISLSPVTWQGVLIWLACYAVTYALAYLLLAGAIRDSVEVASYSSGSTMILLSVVIGVAVVARAWSSSYSSESTTMFVIMSICNICCCILVLFIQFILTREAMRRQESETIRRMGEMKLKQYEFTKENIDIINLKCHDLKHQLLRLEREKNIDDGYIEELKRSVSFYDSVLETGNAALDTVLSDKNLYCVKNKIQLSVVADGKKLGFMSDADVYSLFGNALDNAIEYVMTLDEDKRVIKLSVTATGNLLGISVRNYYEGKPPEFEGGLPVTTKGDRTRHGFGMKSIKSVATKYGGTFDAGVADDAFVVSVLLVI